MLKIDHLNSHYGPIQALYDISLEVKHGELVALVGANGAGKTTLLHAISNLHRASAGKISLGDKEITKWLPHRIVRAGICHVPEGRQVFAPLSVEDNLLLGGYVRRKDKGWMKTELERVYTLFPILRERCKSAAGNLSGGQQQMLVIGRALLGKPELLLLDEPSMGLAPLLVEEIFDIIRELNRQGVTVMLVEQNARAALNIADRGYVLETGHLVLEDCSENLLANKAVQRAYLGYS
ncbi:MAG TPA: ABC transporter ATP-binding protein [Gammaproteobacteria bacterium]|nr:ABC transporter ATP-binding protein [Gammaproteobacteria bacterium]